MLSLPRRSLAFALEAFDGLLGRGDEAAVRAAEGPHVAPECDLLAVVAHWRGSDTPGPATDGPFLACLRALIDLPVRTLEIVVVTDRPADTGSLIDGRLDRSGVSASLSIDPWHPGPRRRHGFTLTWQHKQVFRRALAGSGPAGGPTHLLYLEDDIAFTSRNLEYWLAARAPLAAHGLLPGLVRFERAGARRLLVDQTRPGQHREAVAGLEVPGLGSVAARHSLRPYQACYLYDRRLAEEHLRSSSMRTPLRAEVSGWDLRERAAAGATFGRTASPLRAVLRPDRHRPPSRHAVLVGRDGPGGPVEGALIEHLRPVYSRDPSSRHGKVPVTEF